MTDTICALQATARAARTHCDVASRIRAEYQEMPGMRLTLQQAARLFDLDLTHCARVLMTLVNHGALVTNGREFYNGTIGRHCL